MGVSMAAFTTFIEQFSDVLWNSLLLFLLVGTGVYFTVRLRGVQVRRFGEGFRRVFGGFTLRGKKADAEGMSSFQALTTAIAAQVGTGNITGCATALVSGGPGAPGFASSPAPVFAVAVDAKPLPANSRLSYQTVSCGTDGVMTACVDGRSQAGFVISPAGSYVVGAQESDFKPSVTIG